MFADFRSRNTAAAVSTPIARLSSIRFSPRSHNAAKTAAITPLITPVNTMWLVLNTELFASTSMAVL